MKGKFYTYKNNTYLVIDEGSMKDPSTREWKDCVIYSPVVDGVISSVKYIRDKKEFIERFELKHLKV